MKQVTLAEFSRLKNVSRKTVSEWKKEGRIVIVDGKVDVEASQEKLMRHSRDRAKGARAAVTPTAVTPTRVTPATVIWHTLAPLCGDHLDGEDRGALTAAQRMAEAIPTVLALAAEATGLPATQAKPIEQQFRVSLMETSGLLLDAMAVPPPAGVKSWCAAPMWDPSRFATVDGPGGADETH